MTLIVGLAVVFYFSAGGFCWAQQAPLVGASAPLGSKTPIKPSSAAQQASAGNSAWNKLTPMQQQALKPLEAHWHSISEPQRLKWLAISKNYPSLPPTEQVTMHGRMVEWVALSPVQRAEARLNFAKTNELSKQLTPEEKLAKWQAYQALSASEKENLASKAGPKPIGAALAVRPVAPQKLVGIAPHSQATHHSAKLPSAPASAAPDASQSR